MEYTPISSVTAVAQPAAGRAPSYGLPAEVVDGNDAVAVLHATARAADRARAGDGPTVIEALTYRQYGHSRADPAKYRPKEEVDAWMRRDPLTVLADRLRAGGASEQAIVGAAMGAAMTGLRPVAEIMFSDFLACCFDYVANEIPKMRYMTGGQ